MRVGRVNLENGMELIKDKSKECCIEGGEVKNNRCAWFAVYWFECFSV